MSTAIYNNLSGLNYEDLSRSQSVTQASLAVAEPQGSYEVNNQQWIEVLVDCPGIQGLYTYSIPDDLLVYSGDIVSVPFGMQITGGIAIRLLTSPPQNLDVNKIRPLDDVVISGFFADTYWQLLSRIADYYCADLMSAIRVALPPGLLGRSQRRIRLNTEAIPPGAEAFCSLVAGNILRLLQNQKEGNYSVNYLRNQIKGANRGIRELSKRGWIENYLEPPKRAKPKLKTAVILAAASFLNDLTARQKEILQVLKNRGGELWLKELIQLCHTTSATVKKLRNQRLCNSF